MKSIVFIILVAFSFLTGISQNRIVLQSGVNASAFASLDSAIANAQFGDYIYVPGGAFNIGAVVIDKEIHLIGAGYFPDSTVATDITYLNGSIHIISGADHGSLEGFHLSGEIVFGTSPSDQEVHNYSIRRINFDWLKLSFSGVDTSLSSNMLVTECVIRGYLTTPYDRASVFGANTRNITISHCILAHAVSHFDGNATFEHNVFLHRSPSPNNYYPLFQNCKSINVKNNVILYTHYNNYNIGCSNSIFSNNLFRDGVDVINGNGSYGNISINNIFSIPQNSMFVNQTGFLYDANHDYHLQFSCPGKNAATDGTDVGIFGGNSPYKDGAVPHNPHIYLKSIDAQTNSQGELPVQIKVRAEDN